MEYTILVISGLSYPLLIFSNINTFAFYNRKNMAKLAKPEQPQNTDCFIIMPIADAEGYDKGHFKRVYEDIFRPACIKAGFRPVRADDVKQTNLIHLDILQKLISSPMAICDLSNRNPNVLFELGLRQAFDKPTVLVQEVGTPKIFDISPLRYSEYRRELKYREVLEDQEFIADAIKATREARDSGEGFNSIVSLLSLASPAKLKDVTENDLAKMLQVIMSEMNDLKSDFRNRSVQSEKNGKLYKVTDTIREINNDYSRLKAAFRELKALIERKAPYEEVKEMYQEFNGLLVFVMDSELTPLVQKRVKEMEIIADKFFNDFSLEELL